MMNVVLDNVYPWRHDLAGCLHACAGSLLAHQGMSPLDALGAGWQFHYTAGDSRREEYYFPCRPETSLLASLAPHHHVRSRWHAPQSADDGWEQVRAQVARGVPVAVAVDNFCLPFRPAYRDVHANHLIVVYGFDDHRGTVRVLDTVPPRFDGDIRQDELRAARGSSNTGQHARDMFFAGLQIGHRWLEVQIDEHSPAPDLAGVTAIICHNRDGFLLPVAGAVGYEGLTGLTAFLADIEARLDVGDSIADELFVVAGATLATTALHADWLRSTGIRLAQPALVELGRDVERIAHHWSAVRIMAALTRTGGVCASRLARRHRALLADQQAALTKISDVVENLC